MDRFTEIQKHHEKHGKICRICNVSIIGGPANLKRHMLQHSGTVFPQVVNSQTTHNQNTTDYLRSNLAAKNLPPSVDLDLAQDMILSTPATIRCTGGMFTKGKLAGYTFAGYPYIFLSTGRVKKQFEWIKPSDTTPLFPQPTSTVTRTSDEPRQSDSQVCSTHESLAWQASDSNNLSTVVANVWTPKKYPGWEMPRGCNMEWPCDPTYINQYSKQCDLCDKEICDCIAAKVSSVIPSIVSAGPMGLGVEATVPYQVGDIAGELIGELVPIGSYNNGWVADLERDGLQGESRPVYQVYIRHVGNWTRMINHSCEPNVMFVTMPISGRWRIKA